MVRRILYFEFVVSKIAKGFSPEYPLRKTLKRVVGLQLKVIRKLVIFPNFLTDLEGEKSP